MILNRGCDRRIFTLRQRVVPAHQALYFREFADHFGQQIGLGELRGAFRFLNIRADQRRDLGGEPLDTCNTLRLRAELFVKHDLREFRQPVFEFGLQVRLVEELRIRQARADDALVARDDGLAAVCGFDIRDEDEFRRKSAPLPLAGRGQGWGSVAHRILLLTPLPNPPPQGGRE